MNKLYIYLSLFIFVACSTSNIPHEGLEEKEGLMYEIDSQVPYSGPYEFYSGRSGRNGQSLESIGSYKEGLKDELWKFYYDKGQLKELGNYKNGNRNGPFEFYHDNGQLDTSGNFKDGIMEDGVWKFYYDNGQLKELGNYKNGNPNGPFEAYYDNGQLLNQGNFKDGNMHGIWGYYTRGGSFLNSYYKKLWVDGNEAPIKNKLQSNEVVERNEVVYKVNSTTPFNGTVIYYHTDDNIFFTQAFKLGLLTNQQLGALTEPEEQTLQVELSYFNGKKEGPHKYFKPDGQLDKIGIYRGGKEHGRWYSYWDNSGLKSSIENYNNGLKDGLQKYYYSDGKLAAKLPYKDGKQDGLHERYHNNGQLKEKLKFKNGIVLGEVITYHDNGQIASKGRYSERLIPDGIWEYYNRNGELVSKYCNRYDKNASNFTGTASYASYNLIYCKP